MVAALEAQLYKKYTTGTEVVERVKDVLATVVKSGELPAPSGETYAPLKTVVTALPQVAVIPDGAPSRCFAVNVSCSSTCVFYSYFKFIINYSWTNVAIICEI